MVVGDDDGVTITLMLLKQGYISKMRLLKQIGVPSLFVSLISILFHLLELCMSPLTGH